MLGCKASGVFYYCIHKCPTTAASTCGLRHSTWRAAIRIKVLPSTGCTSTSVVPTSTGKSDNDAESPVL